MPKNRVCIIVVLIAFLCLLAYNTVLLVALNARRAEAVKIAAAQESASRTDGAPESGTKPGSDEEAAVNWFKAEAYPTIKKEIDDAAGYDVPIEVDWDSLAAEGWAHIYDNAFRKVYFTPLVNAIRRFAADPAKKDRLTAVIRKIVVKNEGGYFSTRGISLSDSVLVIDHQPQANIEDAGPDIDGPSAREEHILALLEEEYLRR